MRSREAETESSFIQRVKHQVRFGQSLRFEILQATFASAGENLG